MTIINFLYLRIKLISIGFLYESDANIVRILAKRTYLREKSIDINLI